MSLALLAILSLGAPTASAETPPQAQVEEQDEGQEEVVCRRQLVESSRIGERYRSIRVCKTREEWRSGPSRR